MAADNWNYVLSQRDSRNASQGAVSGWLPNTYGTGIIAPRQQDFFAGITAWATMRGDVRAAQVLAWEHNYLTHRFLAPDANPYDGCHYNLYVGDTVTGVSYTTWAAVEAATVAAGASNGQGWPPSSNSYHWQESTAVMIAMVHMAPNDTMAQQAIAWLLVSQNPQVNAASFQADPTWSLAK